MKKINLKMNKSFSVYFYKLLNDLLLFTLVSYFLALLLEGVLPGMVSQNGGFVILNTILLFTIIFISHLGKNLNINYQAKNKHTFFPVMLVLAFFLIGNSLLKFSLIANIIITSSLMILYYLLYQMIIPSNEKKE